MIIYFIYLKEITLMPFVLFIIGVQSQTLPEPIADLQKDATDGSLFLKTLMPNKKLSKLPRVLMFTAPYKLCEGKCEGAEQQNPQLIFPLFIDKKAKEAYSRIYHSELIFTTKRRTTCFLPRHTVIVNINTQVLSKCQKCSKIKHQSSTCYSIEGLCRKRPNTTTPAVNQSTRTQDTIDDKPIKLQSSLKKDSVPPINNKSAKL